MTSDKKNLPVKTDVLAGTYLKEYGKSLEEYAMRDYDKNAFIKSAMIAIVNNQNLADCLKTDAGKLSLFNALRYAATTGLSLNPQEGKAALVAYKNQKGESIVNYQIMKNGMMDLALDSGKIAHITADYVRERDKFSIKKSTHGDEYEFVPAIKDRGEVIGFFAALKFKKGDVHAKWMTVQEVIEVRDNFSIMYKKNPDNSPWKNSFIGMGVKTVLKALLRNIRISEDLDRGIGADDFYESDFTISPPQLPGASAEDVKEKLETKEEPKPDSQDSQGALL